jgi:hypothetical protein
VIAVCSGVCRARHERDGRHRIYVKRDTRERPPGISAPKPIVWSKIDA